MYPKTVNAYVGQIMTLFLFLDLCSIHQKLEVVFLLGLLVLGYYILICLVLNKAIKVKIFTRINSNQLSTCFEIGHVSYCNNTQQIWCCSLCWSRRRGRNSRSLSKFNNHDEGYSRKYVGELSFDCFERSIKFDKEIEFFRDLLDR